MPLAFYSLAVVAAPEAAPAPKPYKKSAAEIMGNVETFKSEKAYQLSWTRFEEFRESNAEHIEDDYIEYMHFLKEERKYKGSTLWSTYSMLNCMHQVSTLI